MKTSRLTLHGVILILSIVAGAKDLCAQGTAFTYQGRLSSTTSGKVLNGNYDLRAKIFDTASGGTQLGIPLDFLNVNITAGEIALILDFGNVFDGAPRWLEFAVRTAGSGTYSVLAPRPQVLPVPYAIAAARLTGQLPSSALSGVYGNAVSFNNPANVLGGNGASLTFLNASSLASGTVPEARLPATVARTSQTWLLGGNAGTTAGPQFLGTTDNQPLELKVNGLRALRLELSLTGNGAPNVIGGAPVNFIAPGVVGSTIGGGGATNLRGFVFSNSIAASYATIGGGGGNTIQASSFFSTIGGGTGNRIGTNCHGGTIGGGEQNYTGTNCSDCTIGGGFNNRILDNSFYATIPGGEHNIATSDSFAAGYASQAVHSGSFVWSDSSAFSGVSSATANSVTMRAVGGYRLFSDVNASFGVSLAPNGGSWTSISDRNAKDNVQPVDPRQVLAKVAALPVSTWRYKGQDASIRHIGPMAQDFKAAFNVGETNTGITTVDADGVALAAIQGLNQKMDEQQAKLAARDAEVKELKRNVSELKALVEQLAARRSK